MKIIFLGTNGWYDTKTGNTICILVETKERYIILDAGFGLYKIDKYIKKKKPIYLLLSHFHLDHIIGLHVLAKFYFPQGIDIYGPHGLKMFFNRLIQKPYTISVSGLKTEIRLHEISNKNSLPAGIVCRELRHSVFCYGYRVSSENKIVSYGADTGVCKNLFDLAKNSDLFIAECAFKPGQYNKEWPHLNPESAARVAKKANAKKLALVHFDASLYKSAKERKEAEKVSRNIFKNAVSTYDNLCIEV